MHVGAIRLLSVIRSFVFCLDQFSGRDGSGGEREDLLQSITYG